MENSIYVGLSRQTALRRELSLVANNIANINTTSFKREMGIYSAVPTNTAGTGRLDFVIDHGSSVSFEPGSIKNTGNDFDIAINGPGFITVDDGDGIKYTRNGSLSLTSDNQLITRDGDGVVDDGGAPIVIPMDGRKLQIGVDGTISLDNEIIVKVINIKKTLTIHLIIYLFLLFNPNKEFSRNPSISPFKTLSGFVFS